MRRVTHLSSSEVFIDPNVPIRQDLLNKVQKLLRQQQSTGADQKPSLNGPTLPLFNCACTYLTRIHDRKKFLSNSRTHTNAASISAPSTLPYAGHHRGKYHSLEQAAAASVSSSSITAVPASAYASKTEVAGHFVELRSNGIRVDALIQPLHSRGRLAESCLLGMLTGRSWGVSC